MGTVDERFFSRTEASESWGEARYVGDQSRPHTVVITLQVPLHPPIYPHVDSHKDNFDRIQVNESYARRILIRKPRALLVPAGRRAGIKLKVKTGPSCDAGLLVKRADTSRECERGVMSTSPMS